MGRGRGFASAPGGGGNSVEDAESFDSLFDHPAGACTALVVSATTAMDTCADGGDGDGDGYESEVVDLSGGLTAYNFEETDDEVRFERHGASQRHGRRTSYDRQDGKGCRKGWTEKGVAHLASIAPGGSFFASNPCEEKQRIAALRACPRGGRCMEHVRPRDVMDCLISTYGDPMLDAGRQATAATWPSIRNHAAGNWRQAAAAPATAAFRLLPHTHCCAARL